MAGSLHLRLRSRPGLPDHDHKSMTIFRAGINGAATEADPSLPDVRRPGDRAEARRYPATFGLSDAVARRSTASAAATRQGSAFGFGPPLGPCSIVQVLADQSMMTTAGKAFSSSSKSASVQLRVGDDFRCADPLRQQRPRPPIAARYTRAMVETGGHVRTMKLTLADDRAHACGKQRRQIAAHACGGRPAGRADDRPGLAGEGPTAYRSRCSSETAVVPSVASALAILAALASRSVNTLPVDSTASPARSDASSDSGAEICQWMLQSVP